jgi:hypothetical protein
MAKEKTYSEVLNLRVEPALDAEIKRIARHNSSAASEAARMLLTWGVEAHRAMEARLLQRPYDYQPDDDYFPRRMVIDVHWESFEPETGETVHPVRP